MATKKNIEEKKCECSNCTCENEPNYLKYIFYTLVSIFVCVLISTIFVIIIAVDNDNENKNNNTSLNSYANTENTGNGSNNGGEIVNPEYDTSMFEEINASKFIELFNGSEQSLIYIGRPGCGYCVQFLPSLQKAQDEFGYKTYYLDIDTITDEEYYEISGLNEFLENNFGFTPMVLVVQNGQIAGEGWVGYNEYDAFKTYLESIGYQAK